MSNPTTTLLEDSQAVRATEAASGPREAATNQAISVKFLYLVRHGEAMHNVLEKEAQEKASREAEALGIQKGSETQKEMLETARKAVLRSINHADPELSSCGQQQAIESKAEMLRLTSKLDTPLPEPSMVVVSPLQRALQTAALIFPNHPKVHVHSAVQERHTGLACDKPSSAAKMCRHEAFSFMDFGIPLKEETEATVSEQVEEHEHGYADGVGVGQCLSECKVFEPETAADLRRRTAKISELLWKCNDAAVCIVSHKGYLRELERGVLGRPEAKEFLPAEIRVYEVWQDSECSMGAVLRHCEGIFPAK